MPSQAEEQFLGLLVRGGIPRQDIEREVKFAPPRQWKADFLIPKLRLIIEVDGGVFKEGLTRHITPHGYREDCEKQRKAVLRGYGYIRSTTEGKQLADTAYDVVRLYNKVAKE